MDTKLSPINLAMASVLRDAEPKSISRRKAAESMSVSEGQLNRLLGGNPEYVRDISITVLYELADVWGISLVDLIRRAEALASEMSEADDTTIDLDTKRKQKAAEAMTAQQIDQAHIDGTTPMAALGLNDEFDSDEPEAP